MDSQLKKRVMDEIEKSSSNFSMVNASQYRLRCPICGDSLKNPKSAHCYIKCDYGNPTEPLLYNCFKCNAHGIVDNRFLEKLGIGEMISDDKRSHIYWRGKKEGKELDVGKAEIKSPQTDYIDYRLQHHFSIDDLNRFRIVWNMDKLREYISYPSVLARLPSNFVAI